MEIPWEYHGNTMGMPENPRRYHEAKCACVSSDSKIGQDRFQKLDKKMVNNGYSSQPVITFLKKGIFS